MTVRDFIEPHFKPHTLQVPSCLLVLPHYRVGTNHELTLLMKDYIHSSYLGWHGGRSHSSHMTLRPTCLHVATSVIFSHQFECPSTEKRNQVKSSRHRRSRGSWKFRKDGATRKFVIDMLVLHQGRRLLQAFGDIRNRW